jgi:ABC-type transporter MlaC component
MKNHPYFLFILAFIFSSGSLLAEEAADTVPATATATAPKYTGEAETIVKYLEELFAASKKVNTEGPEKNKSRSAIESALDWEKVAQLCLGTSRWKTTGAKNRSDFRNLLKDVIVKTAYTRLDKFWTPDLTYTFEKVEIKGGEARVPTKFTVKGEPFILEYFLFKKGGKWTIYDISYEEVRYSVNINEQIDAFLREKNFADLLGKLRKRLEDLSAEGKKKA